jgi:hypothetical protein
VARVPEPDLTSRSGHTPEGQLQMSVEAEVAALLENERQAGELLDYLVLPRFGLDICVFGEWTAGRTVRLFELKVFTTSSNRVGITSGNQVELLLHSSADTYVLWILADSRMPLGAARYVLFDSVVGRDAVMGAGPGHGKQNNFRVDQLMDKATTWATLSGRLLSSMRPSTASHVVGG